MSDLYLEELVKKKRGMKDVALKSVLIAGTIALVILALLSFSPIFIVPAIAICVFDIFFFSRYHLEWEYQYVNGELDVDRILNRARRKRMASYDVATMEMVAPSASHRLDYYNSNSKLKTIDYTSGDPEREKLVYVMLTPGKDGLTKVLFEPSEQMLKDMRVKAPRKVFLIKFAD